MKEQEIKLALVSRKNWARNNEAQTLRLEFERQDSPQTGRKIQSPTAGHPFLNVTELELFKEQEGEHFLRSHKTRKTVSEVEGKNEDDQKV